MIYITRHGQTDWNVQKRIMGKIDEPLNKTGIEQANITKDNLTGIDIDLIICSPLLRAKQTAQIINEVLKADIIYDERISERSFGEFEGMETKNFDFLGFWDYYKNDKFAKAENIQDFFQRIYSFLDDITKKYYNKNIMLVAHGGVSIPVDCYFNKNIPEGSLMEVKPLLNNCEVRTYDLN